LTGTTALLEDIERDRLITEPKRHYGGPQSGLPPDFIVGSELAPHLIVGIDFGLTGIRVATFANEIPFALKPREFASGIRFDVNGDPRPAEANSARLFPRKGLGSSSPLLIDGRYFWSEELCTVVLKDMKERIEQEYDRLLAKAVITVPSAFTHLQRTGLLYSAKNAGIQVLSLINQPTAAGLSCAFFNELPSGNYLSVSVGETSCECSLIDLQTTLVEVKTAKSDPRLCGEALFRKAADEFLKFGMDITDKQCAFTERELMRVVRLFINELGSMESVTPQFSEKQYIRVTRDDVLAWFEPVLQQYVSLFNETLKQAHVPKEKLSGIIVSGGISKLWLVDGVLKFFAQNINVHQTTYADDVSTGAALYAALLVRQAKDWVIWDTIGGSVSVAAGDLCKQVIAPDSPMPITGHVTLAPNDTGGVVAQILQADPTSNSDGIVCAVVEIPDVPPTSEDPTCVDLAVHVRADGTLDLSARHKFLDVHLPMKVTPPVSIDDLVYDIGVTLKLSPSGVYYVNSVEPFSDAEAAGIEIYDVLIAKNNLRIDPLSTDVFNPLRGKSGEIITLTVARGKERITKDLECKLSRTSWDKSKFESLLLDSVYVDNPNIMITRLLQYAELCAFRSRLPEYGLARKNYERAAKFSREKLSKHDPLRVATLCKMCKYEILEYDCLMKAGQESAVTPNRDAIDSLCSEIMNLTSDKRICTKEVSEEIRQLAGMMLRSPIGAVFRTHTMALFRRAMKIASDNKIPKDIAESLKEEFKHAGFLLYRDELKESIARMQALLAKKFQQVRKVPTRAEKYKKQQEEVLQHQLYKVGVETEWLWSQSRWMVGDVDPLLLAMHADIQVFDIVLAVNGVWANKLFSAEELLRGNQGEVKCLHLKRGEEFLEVQLSCRQPVSPWERAETVHRELFHSSVVDPRERIALFLIKGGLNMESGQVEEALKHFEWALVVANQYVEPRDSLRLIAIGKLCQCIVRMLDETLLLSSEQIDQVSKCRDQMIACVRGDKANKPEVARILYETAQAMQASVHWKDFRWPSLHLFSLAINELKKVPHPAEVLESYQQAYDNACRRI
jgi:molecular chaperone HscC